jgi:hypothetical protein
LAKISISFFNSGVGDRTQTRLSSSPALSEEYLKREFPFPLSIDIKRSRTIST